MKHITLTEEELTTLLWAVHDKSTAETIRLVNAGEIPQLNERMKRLNSISKKAYIALTCDAEE